MAKRNIAAYKRLKCAFHQSNIINNRNENENSQQVDDEVYQNKTIRIRQHGVATSPKSS